MKGKFNEQAVELLSDLSLTTVMERLAELLIAELDQSTVGVLIWDEDLEEFSDRGVYGSQRTDLESRLDEIVGTLEQSSEPIVELDSGLAVRVADDDGLVAVIVLAFGKKSSGEALIERLDRLPVVTALRNAWVHTELERENRRLRSSYDELEDKTSNLEDQTRKLIHDLTARDSIRTKQVERERLVYWISNAVRSSVRIQDVLDSTVEKVGTTLGLSRCHLLRQDLSGEVEVYEFTGKGVVSVRDALLEGQGLEFTRQALHIKSPHHLDDPEEHDYERDDSSPFKSGFLKMLGLRSGLIVPMIMAERVLGVVFLEDCEVPREWNIDDISLIGSLADHLAVAIENAELHRELERQAVTDGLTGVANRRSFNEALEKEFERAKRYGQDLSLLVVDLDYLKKINDTYGHMTGDEAIKAIGTVLAQSSRAADTTARYGGEEFCVLLPNTGIDMAEQLGERLRRLINESTIEGVGKLSASIGVASFPLHSDSPDLLFLRADEALYRAKQDGRNLLRVSDLDPAGEPLKTSKTNVPERAS